MCCSTVFVFTRIRTRMQARARDVLSLARTRSLPLPLSRVRALGRSLARSFPVGNRSLRLSLYRASVCLCVCVCRQSRSLRFAQTCSIVTSLRYVLVELLTLSDFSLEPVRYSHVRLRSRTPRGLKLCSLVGIACSSWATTQRYGTL